MGTGSINRRADLASGSVRRRLLSLLLLPLLTLLAISVWTDYRTAIEPALTAYDQALADAALAVAAHVRGIFSDASRDIRHLGHETVHPSMPLR